MSGLLNPYRFGLVAGSGITYVGAASSNFSATRSPVVSYPSGLAVNDILLVTISTDTSHSSDGTPPTGITKLHEATDSLPDQTGSLFWKRATGGETSETWTNIFAAATTETGIVVVVAYRGCITTGSPVNVSVAETSTSGTSAKDIGPVTTTVNNCMAVGILTIDPGANPRNFAWDAGITERIGSGTTPSGQNSTLGGIYIGEKLVVTAGSATMGGDFDDVEHASEFIVALAPQ